jgi:ABC-type multidrug transport system fused ATPase/permease subunit
VDTNSPSVMITNANDLSHENLVRGSVSWHIYKSYLAAGGSGLLYLLVLIIIILSQASITATSYILADWTNPDNSTEQQLFYLKLFGYVCAAASVLLLLRGIILSYVTLKAGNNLHNTFLSNILFAPQYFFDTTPTGRILNRFTRDQSEVDNDLPNGVSDIIITIVNLLAVISLLIYVLYYAAIAVVVLSIVYYVIQKYYRPACREIKRMESISRSPMYQIFQQTSVGLFTIRSFNFSNNSMKYAIQDCYNRVDDNFRLFLFSFGVHRWLALRSESLGLLFGLVTSLLSIFLINSIGIGLASLAITTSGGLSGDIYWLIRCIATLETQMNSVERIIEYSSIKPEGSINNKNNAVIPHNNWPQNARVDIKNFSIGYNPQANDSNAILKDITASINSGEKIGIVGRTGSGMYF